MALEFSGEIYISRVSSEAFRNAFRECCIEEELVV